MSLKSCTAEVCSAAALVSRAATEAIEALDRLEATAECLDAIAASSGQALQCVINGPVGGACDLPLGGSLPTLAEALARLNLTSIGAIAVESFTAIGGDTGVTLSTEVSNALYLEVALDGVLLSNPSDYTVSGTAITFPMPLEAGDTVSARIFSLA